MIKKTAIIFNTILAYVLLLLLQSNVYADDTFAPFQDQLSQLLSQSDKDTSKYLGILLNRTYGIDPDANISNIQDPNTNHDSDDNLLRGLIFLNPGNTKYVYANPALSIPWWYNPDLDIIPTTQDNQTNSNNLRFPDNPAVQSIINSMSSIYGVDCNANSSTNNSNDCMQPDYSQNIVNLIFDDQGNIDQEKLSQLSISSLLEPLQYDNNHTSSQENAENFVRLISAAMLSLKLDPQYEDVLDTARGNVPGNPNTSRNQALIKQKQQELATYNSQILGYASRSSIAIDNLYYLMSRRIPNRDTQKSINQAEFDMVQNRIDPHGDWKTNLNNQSLNATMRDIAELLAEQQFQSYLRGQENEHLIATLTTLVIQQQEFLKMNYFIDTDDTVSLQ